jgi:predicted Fe-Mo cluster-binding NifX family protein
MIVDSETGECRAKPRAATGHGGCAPLALLAGEEIQGVLVGGIGRGALLQLLRMGIALYETADETVANALTSLKAGQLRRLDDGASCCGGHEHGQDHQCGCENHD